MTSIATVGQSIASGCCLSFASSAVWLIVCSSSYRYGSADFLWPRAPRVGADPFDPCPLSRHQSRSSGHHGAACGPLVHMLRACGLV